MNKKGIIIGIIVIVIIVVLAIIFGGGKKTAAPTTSPEALENPQQIINDINNLQVDDINQEFQDIDKQIENL